MKDVIKKYTNGEVTIVWQPKLCIHSTICFVELPNVFDPGDRPWINAKGAPTDKIIEIVNKCPTSALTYFMNKDIPDAEATEETVKEEKEVEITLLKDGPYVIKGPYKIYDCKGNKVHNEAKVALCRCGASLTKPFCDGMHNLVKFRD